MFGFGKKNEDVVFKPIDRYGIKIQQLNERIDDLQEAVYLLNNPKEKEKRRIEKLVKYVNKGHDGLRILKRKLPSITHGKKNKHFGRA